MRWDSDIILQYLNELPKAILDCASPTGNTMLHQVAREGNTRLFDMPVGKSVNISAKNSRNETPLYIATQRLDTSLIKRSLEAGADATITTDPRCKCVVGGLEERGDSLTSSDGSIVEAVHGALCIYNLSLVGFMLGHGVDLSWEDWEGRTLMEVVLLKFVSDKSINLILNGCGKRMLSDSWERLTFGCSSFRFEENTVRRLVEGTVAARGSFENQRDFWGATTLHNFASSRCVLGVKLLLEKGADVFAHDEFR
ncbi:hypothetical protein IFR05_006148 [Cadophora sp. M221]|nr:hypothetical protein IFR05_006148 [Cadophora sp. M221]